MADLLQRGNRRVLRRVFVFHRNFSCDVWRDIPTDVSDYLFTPISFEATGHLIFEWEKPELASLKTKNIPANFTASNPPIRLDGYLQRPTMPCLPTGPRHSTYSQPREAYTRQQHFSQRDGTQRSRQDLFCQYLDSYAFPLCLDLFKRQGLCATWSHLPSQQADLAG
jgi:hypothetical protein